MAKAYEVQRSLMSAARRGTLNDSFDVRDYALGWMGMTVLVSGKRMIKSLTRRLTQDPTNPRRSSSTR